MASKSKKNKRADGNDGQTEVLSNFISVTGKRKGITVYLFSHSNEKFLTYSHQPFHDASGASEEVAKNMLEACNNELDMAIGMYLDSGLAEDSGGGGAGGSRGLNGRSSASASPKRNGGRRRSKTKVRPS